MNNKHINNKSLSKTYFEKKYNIYIYKQQYWIHGYFRRDPPPLPPPFHCWQTFSPRLEFATPSPNGIRPVFMSLNSPADIDG